MPTLRSHAEVRWYIRSEQEKVEIRRRRAEASWHDWVLIEFLRYLYALALLAAVVFVPLQMADSWLKPPVAPSTPAAVAVAVVAFAGVVLYFGLRGYWFLGRKDGGIDQRLARGAEPADRESH